MEEILIFGHKNPDTDSICSSIVKERIEKKKGNKNVRAVSIGNINKETKYALDYIGIKPPKVIEKIKENQEVMLIDHNEFEQSVEGIEKAQIISVTDHHRIANFKTSAPIYYLAKPYACTSTILFEDYKLSGYEIEKEDALLMASAIISDTLLLKSPTTTKKDIEVLQELGEIAQTDINQYGLEMLKAGTDLNDFSEKELIDLDAKRTEKDGAKIVIAQVNTVSIEEVLERKEKLEKVMENEINENNLDLFVFVITDILNSNSELLVLGKRADATEKAFGKNLENNLMFLKGVVSRKKQILPQIDQNM